MSTPSSKGSARGKGKLPRVVILKVSPSKLSDWPHEKPAAKPSSTQSESTSSTPLSASKHSSPATEVKKEVKTEPSVAAAADSSTLQVPTDGRKGKGPGGLKGGTKRPNSALVDGPPKPRAKPGPKKRKLDGPLGPEEANRPWTTPAQTVGHKLGPKANQGAINAGLRALDRTGKPCRKWNKTGFTVKSFTGIVWSLPTWAAPTKKNQANGENGESGTPTSTSENPLANDGSNVDSASTPGKNGLDASNAPTPAAVTAAA